eukprot:scaffold473204_cov35-Attheya_sp.AAC.1
MSTSTSRAAYPGGGGETPMAAYSATSRFKTTAPTTAPKAKDVEGDDEFLRDYYLADDDAAYVADVHGPAGEGEMGRFLFESRKTKQRELEMARKRQEGGGGLVRPQRMSAKRSALNDDQDAWEENRLLSSGAAVQGHVSLDINTDDDSRITLLVHQVKPPFLDSKASFSTVREAVPT